MMIHHLKLNQIARRCGVVLGVLALIGVPVMADEFGQDATSNAAEGDLDLTGVEVDEFDTFNIQVQDTDLAQVLQMLALQGERNVIASRNVSAVITANLFDVTFEEALDAILKPNGFRWVEEGKFIYVYTQEEFARMEALDRKTESRMFELEHLSARDASEFAMPLLSDRGKLSFIGEVSGGIERDLGNMGGDTWAKAAILVVNDYPDRPERISELIAEIDTAPRQVVVDATIASVAVVEEDAFGVDFSIMGNLDITKLVSPLGPVSDLLRGNNALPKGVTGNVAQPPYNGSSTAWGTQSTPGNTQGGKSNFMVGLVAGDASVFVRALDQVTDTMVLARPRIMALNRQRAQVMVGKRVAYLSTTATDTTSTQTVQYLDTGVKLMIRPFISKDDTIRMEVYPSVSSAELRKIRNGGLGNEIEVPDEFTNEISTNVKVRNGETLVLGGLFQEQTTISNSQVPFLGDIPLLGAAFSGHDNTVNRREIIFMITPKIVEDQLIEESGRQGMAFVNSLRAGMREGLLPFSREKMSSQHNQDAFEAMNAGDFELSLFHFDNSLRLNPGQPEVRRLRAETAGESGGGFYDYDIWRRVMEDQHADHADQKDDEARVNSVFDPLAAAPADAGADADVDAQTRSEEREDRFLDALVNDLDRDETMASAAKNFEVDSSESGIYFVEAEPMSVATAFGDVAEDSQGDFGPIEGVKAATAVETTTDSVDEILTPTEVAMETTTDSVDETLAPTEVAMETTTDSVDEILTPTEVAMETTTDSVDETSAPTEVAMETTTESVDETSAPTEVAMETATESVDASPAPTEVAMETTTDSVDEILAPTEVAMKTAEDSVDAAAASAELTQKKPVAEAKVTTAAANSKRESAVKAMLVIEPTVTPFEIDKESTSEDAMDLAADTQEVLVLAPRSPVWGRLWWLARIASQQSRAFANEPVPGIEMVTAEEDN